MPRPVSRHGGEVVRAATRCAALVIGLVLSGCAAPRSSSESASAAYGQEELARGGPLAGLALPARSVFVDGEALVGWGEAEAPAGSNLQAVIAMAEAQARNAILSGVEISVASSTVDVEAEADGKTTRRDARLSTAEAVRGAFPRSGRSEHGWTRLRRGREYIIVVRVRVTLPLDALRQSLVRAIGPETTARIVKGLGSATSATERKPDWAERGDDVTDAGHTFSCMGQGNSEEDALAAAKAICSDKICKLCGVEVESILKATETLEGVEVQRVVVERCRRVRRKEANVRYKSSDCGPSGCTSWIQVEFTKEDEAAECRTYADEDFDDPDACERHIDAFRNTEGRSAASFVQRRTHLDAALGACQNIDVRPTPLLQALDAKLSAGLDIFEFTPDAQRRFAQQRSNSGMVSSRFRRAGETAQDQALRDRPLWAWYLTTDLALRQQLRETKRLVERIRGMRDYVDNKARVFAVIEAASADDLDSKPGMDRLLSAMREAPTGSQYGAPWVHMLALNALERVRGSTAGVRSWFVDTYAPASIEPRYAETVTRFFRGDKAVDALEWDYVMALHERQSCRHCLRWLIDTPKHDSPNARDERLHAALHKVLPPEGDDRKRFRAFESVAGKDPAFLLEQEASLPADLQRGFTWDFLVELWRVAQRRNDRDLRMRVLARLAQSLTATGSEQVDRSYCNSLPKRMQLLETYDATPPALDLHICACLEGPFRSDGTRNFVSKSDLYDVALTRSLSCVMPR